jgi:hypothetical protein
MGGKFRKCKGIFIIDAIVIFPFVKISHEKPLFGKFTMKMSHFWKIYHENNKILGIYHKNTENLPYYGNISLEIGVLGKFPCIYVDMPRDEGEPCKKYSIIQRSPWSRGYSGCLLCGGLGVQNLQNIKRTLAAKFPSRHGNFEISTLKFGSE